MQTLRTQNVTAVLKFPDSQKQQTLRTVSRYGRSDAIATDGNRYGRSAVPLWPALRTSVALWPVRRTAMAGATDVRSAMAGTAEVDENATDAKRYGGYKIS